MADTQLYQLNRTVLASATGETQAAIRIPKDAEGLTVESFGGPETTFVLTYLVPVDDVDPAEADSDGADS